jgi:hypothetical protein
MSQTATSSSAFASSSRIARDFGSSTVARSRRRPPVRAARHLPPQACRVALDEFAEPVADRLWKAVAGRETIGAHRERAAHRRPGNAEIRVDDLERRPDRTSVHQVQPLDPQDRQVRIEPCPGESRQPVDVDDRPVLAHFRERGQSQGARTCSACHVSAASISAEALAAAMSIPLPLNTALDRAFGRQTMTTGMPVRSSPVRLATRVIPRTSLCARTRAIVSSAVKARIARGS